MASRVGLWALSGATAAAGVLIASPDAYAWLRRTVGLERGEALVDAPATDDDTLESTFDTREARLSLRARLNEAEAETQVVPPPAEERPLAARPRPTRDEVEPMRRAVDEARTRMLETARKATQENGPAA